MEKNILYKYNYKKDGVAILISYKGISEQVILSGIKKHVSKMEQLCTKNTL